MYDAVTCRFWALDNYAEKYFSMSPYQYAANNPIKFIDVNGDSIWFTYQYDKKNQLSGVTMHITGKVINVSNKSINMEDAVKSISNQLTSSFQGDFDGISFNTDVDLSVANTMDDVNENDHVFALAEMSSDSYEGKAQDYGAKVAFISADYFSGIWDTNIGNKGERTAAHEFGHLANLYHINSYYNLMNGESNNTFYSFATSLNNNQLKSVYNSWKNGYLNKGKNHEYIMKGTAKGIIKVKMPNRGKNPERIIY